MDAIASPRQVKERPIIFSAAMVRAILEGRKTQTRRIVKGPALSWIDDDGFTPEYVASGENGLCPYGKAGDRLWVRETFSHVLYNGPENGRGPGFIYRADMRCDRGDDWSGLVRPEDKHWKPSIHMPRKASRITLEIVSVRVERLQDISHAEALAEGCDGSVHGLGAQEDYRSLWVDIHGNGSWDANSWVWVLEFNRVDA